MTRDTLIYWLHEENVEKLKELWQYADEIRRTNVGNAVHLRGLIEISNYCVRQCAYCGLRSDNHRITRYRMTITEIMECVRLAVQCGYGSVVLQSGEDFGITTGWMAGLIHRIKSETSLAVTLSLGERSYEDLIVWREAGADRFLLRFETSNRELYEHIHPSLPGKKSDRFEILKALKKTGYEVGSGIMIGLPGQTYDDIVNDLEMFKVLDLDMIGVGPYIPHPDTPLGRNENQLKIQTDRQAPNTEMMTYKVIALTRILCPEVNIPSTTALATLNREQGRELGLSRGANVIMPNLTPPSYRVKYEIYPSKACIFETAGECYNCLQKRILSLDREIGTGRGDSRNYKIENVKQDMEKRL